MNINVNKHVGLTLESNHIRIDSNPFSGVNRTRTESKLFLVATRTALVRMSASMCLSGCCCDESMTLWVHRSVSPLSSVVVEFN